METIILGVIGVPQLILIVLVLLLLFGGAKIPTLMKNLGKGINEFKKSTRGEYGDADDGKDAKTIRPETKKNNNGGISRKNAQSSFGT